jgi:hypothetical protein
MILNPLRALIFLLFLINISYSFDIFDLNPFKDPNVKSWKDIIKFLLDKKTFIPKKI